VNDARVDESTALRDASDRVSAGHTDPSYWNFNGPFGGWIASVLLQHVLDDPRRKGDPISTSTTFAGPIEPGPFTIHVRRLRANRSTDFWWAELRQEQNGAEAVCAYATVGLAQRRSTPSFLEQPMPAARPPEDVPERERPLPLRWFEHFELRIAEGDPFRGKSSARSLAWARKKNAALDFAGLTEICDTAIPRIFFHTKGPVPIATVTMNVFYHASESELREVGNDFVLCEANWRIMHDGYFDEQQLVWNRAGQLLATTEQIVWFRLPEDGAAR